MDLIFDFSALMLLTRRSLVGCWMPVGHGHGKTMNADALVDYCPLRMSWPTNDSFIVPIRWFWPRLTTGTWTGQPVQWCNESTTKPCDQRQQGDNYLAAFKFLGLAEALLNRFVLHSWFRFAIHLNLHSQKTLADNGKRCKVRNIPANSTVLSDRAIIQ